MCLAPLFAATALGPGAPQPPAIARATADGTSVTLVWYFARGATGGYDIVRSAEPSAAGQVIGHVSPGTSGFKDANPGPAPWFYQVVALGAGGARAPSATIALVPPVITSIVPQGTDALVTWSRSGPPANYSILRSTDPRHGGVAVGGGASPFLVRNAGSGTVYFQVVALSPGSVSAASAWVPLSTPTVAAIATAPVQAPAAAGQSVVTQVPAILNLQIVSSSPITHELQWVCGSSEVPCSSCKTGTANCQAVSYQYEVAVREPGAAGFSPLAASGAPNPTTACTQPAPNDPSTCLHAVYRYVFTGTPVAQTIYRVTRKDPSGAQMQAYAQVAYDSPPPAVPTNQVAPGASLADAYRVAPAHSVPFLSKNNGAGSPVSAQQYLAANGHHVGETLKDNAANTSKWDWKPSCDDLWCDGLDPKTDPGCCFAIFRSAAVGTRWANVTELGVGRSVLCWQWPITTQVTTPANTLSVLQGYDTFCIAGKHGDPPGPHPPDRAALTAAALGTPNNYSVILLTPTSQYFASFDPEHTPGVIARDLVNLDDRNWGWDWNTIDHATFDDEGPKAVPNACLTCHGGTYDATTGKVRGASLLPVDPGLVVIADQIDPARWEEQIRGINAMITKSGSAAAIVDYINGLYGGKVDTQGAVAQRDYVPPGWTQQSDLYRLVVKPDCALCHLAVPASHNFSSFGNLTRNKAAVYSDVCVAHSMPNAEVPYQHFWTSTRQVGSTTLNLAGYLMASLGYTSCP